jgi:NADH-quinone oxidoreductase subunit M
LWLYQRVFFGTVTNPKNALLADLSGREIATFVPLVLLAFWLGIYPKPFFEILDQPVQELVLRVNTNPGIYNATVPRTVPAETPTKVTTPAMNTPATASKPSSPTTIAQERVLEQ